MNVYACIYNYISFMIWFKNIRSTVSYLAHQQSHLVVGKNQDLDQFPGIQVLVYNANYNTPSQIRTSVLVGYAELLRPRFVLFASAFGFSAFSISYSTSFYIYYS
jgi:hypothetical protein